MGYYTYTTITAKTNIDQKTSDLVSEAIKKLFVIDRFEEESTGFYDLGPIKYGGDDDPMHTLSHMFPEILFAINGDGDESTDTWTEYWQNGHYQRCDVDTGNYGQPYHKGRMKHYIPLGQPNNGDNLSLEDRVKRYIGTFLPDMDTILDKLYAAKENPTDDDIKAVIDACAKPTRYMLITVEERDISQEIFTERKDAVATMLKELIDRGCPDEVCDAISNNEPSYCVDDCSYNDTQAFLNDGNNHDNYDWMIVEI